MTYGSLHKGFEYPVLSFVVIAENDIFSARKMKKLKKKKHDGKNIASFNELNIGDYVVHESHGLGVYKGIEKIQVEGVEKDYIKIAYANNGNLYVLATQLDRKELVRLYAIRQKVEVTDFHRILYGRRNLRKCFLMRRQMTSLMPLRIPRRIWKAAGLWTDLYVAMSDMERQKLR